MRGFRELVGPDLNVVKDCPDVGPIKPGIEPLDLLIERADWWRALMGVRRNAPWCKRNAQEVMAHMAEAKAADAVWIWADASLATQALVTLVVWMLWHQDIPLSKVNLVQFDVPAFHMLPPRQLQAHPKPHPN